MGKQIYKLSLIRNTRFLFIVVFLVVSFLINFPLYQRTESGLKFLFLSFAIIAVIVLSYILLKKNDLFKQQIVIEDDYIEFLNKTNTKVFYKDIKYAGYYKKDLNDKINFKFKDAMYLYNERDDIYFLISPGFKNILQLYSIMEEKCKSYRVNWNNIHRTRSTSFINELKKLLNS